MEGLIFGILRYDVQNKIWTILKSSYFVFF